MVQTHSDNRYIYLVDLMFMYVNNKNIVSKKIKTSKLFPQLKHKCWGDPMKPNEQLSPIQVIKNKDISIKDYERIKKADLRYPIMIDSRIDDSHNFNIIDGMHRLSKAYLQKKKYIRAYVFNKDIMKKFIVSKISEGWKYRDSLTKKNIEKIYNERFMK